jgi:hypothetical protein
MKPNMEELLAQAAARTKARNERIAVLMQEELLDDDGYPTDAALDIIEMWDIMDPKGWFDFIKSIWHIASWGWSEGESAHEYKEDKMVYQYHISTAGWSGNESIITRMQANDMMWHLNWVQSSRGGHYIFELYQYKGEE